ncbi:Flp1 family type IVb pilin [Paenibacillus thermotolerans]|uniref:Flp1 family type IVb pilin n=1 Tax=Paenibacillus thermotolerans TaxID=3027807 RepID=UPI0023684A21|nr:MULTISPECIES: Flp1 family type IVb pilin [unclassified Paenibacillus]
MMNKVRNWGNRFWKDEEGIGTLEMLLIVAIILVIAIAFRKWIMKWVNDLFQKTQGQVTNTINDNTIQLP